MQISLTDGLRRNAFLALLPLFLMLLAQSEAVAQKVKAWEIKYDTVMKQSGTSDMTSEEKAYLEMAALMVSGGGKEPVLQILVAKDYIRVTEKGLLGNKVSVADKRDSVYYMLDAESKVATAYPAGLPKIDTRLVGDSLVVMSSDDFTFEYTQEEKKIAGYRCKKVITHSPADTTNAAQIEIWYTDKLPKTYWGEYGYLEKVPGAALAVLSNTSGFTIGIQVKKVKKKKANVEDFMIPNDYSLQDDIMEYAQDSVYDYVGPYMDGLAVVSLDYKYGYINENREEVIPVAYDVAGNFSNGVAVVGKEEKYGIINAKGKALTQFKYTVIMDFHDGLAAVLEGEKYGYLDTLGNVVVPFKYDSAFDFKEGVAQVYANEKFGFIDKKGREVTPLKYDLVYDFAEGLARVWVNDKYGFIDKTGREVIPVQYDWADDFFEGKARVQLNNKEFTIDTNGKKAK